MGYSYPIYISEEAKDKLEQIKIHPNQAFGEVIDKLLKIKKDIIINEDKL